MEKIKVVFVCLGNICRSPMAEGLFLHLIKETGLSERFEVDSAGTSSYHVGERADSRMRDTAGQHGVHLPSRARQFLRQDLEDFDYVLAMDDSNKKNILRIAPLGGDFPASLHLMREFDPEPGDGNVPDPYYGGREGFENVYQMLLRSNQRFLEVLREKHGF